MPIVYSPYQIALFDFIQNETGSAIVDAKAGAGKTSSIIEACKRLSEESSVLFLAFNTSIVAELKAKLPAGVSCSTFNSCGWAAWRNFTGKKFMKIDEKKTWNIIWNNFSDTDSVLYGSFVAIMVALAKSSGLTPDSAIEQWWAVQDHHSVLLASEDGNYDRAMELSRKTLSVSIEQAYNICDFDDQIYMPWLRNASFNKFDAVFIDEAQDTNSVQKDLLKRMLNPGGRLIAVGDPQQACYGFRGADHRSMADIGEAFNAKVLPLSICYRCCKAVITEAQKYVPEIEAFSESPEGEVQHLDNYDINNFTANDAVICRNNAPLIAFAYQTISRGRGVNFLGRDIAGGLQTLIRNMEAKDLTNLSLKLTAWLTRESEKLIAKHQEDKIEILTDRVACIETFIRYLPESKQTIGDLLSAIDSLFEAKGRGITLCSVHKAKGREWERVFILDFAKLMPSKHAKKDWCKVQENNLIYVAITRAQKYLGYINSNMWKDSPNLIIPERKISDIVPKKSKVNKEILSGFQPYK